MKLLKEIGECSLCNNVRPLVYQADIPICLRCNKTYHNKPKTQSVKIIDEIKLTKDYESGLTIKDLSLKNKCGIELIRSKLKACGSYEWRKHQSATRQGIELKDWKGYVTEKPYCDKFNESCKEHNREKYGNQCFVCGKTKEENSNRALSVHHVTKNKMEGCDGSKWQLIPLCAVCHGKAHFEPLESRINFLLND